MKQCFKCGLSKPLDMFYKHPRMSDGRLGKCKECAKRDVRGNYAKNVDYFRAYDCVRYHEAGNRSKAVSRNNRAAKDRWRELNQHKLDAQQAVQYAVKRGRLERPDSCSACGKECRPHGHHDDYSKQLEVRWLCPACHMAHHRKHDPEEARALLESRRRAG